MLISAMPDIHTKLIYLKNFSASSESSIELSELILLLLPVKGRINELNTQT